MLAMMRDRFRIHAEAAKEITDAISWHAQQRDEKLADRFTDAVNEAFDKILTSPERFAKYLLGTRYVRVTDFNYVVVYRDIGNLVHVIAVAHTSRRPGYWKDRLGDREEF
jgi:toxin ParE1/3/4